MVCSPHCCSHCQLGAERQACGTWLTRARFLTILSFGWTESRFGDRFSPAEQNMNNVNMARLTEDLVYKSIVYRNGHVTDHLLVCHCDSLPVCCCDFLPVCDHDSLPASYRDSALGHRLWTRSIFAALVEDPASIDWD